MKFETRLSTLLVPMLLMGSVAFCDTLTFSGECHLEHRDLGAPGDRPIGTFNVEAKELEDVTQHIAFTIPGSKQDAGVFIQFDRRRTVDELGLGYRWREELNGFASNRESYTFISRKKPDAITPGLKLSFKTHIQYIIVQNQIHPTAYYVVCSGLVK